MLSSSFLIPSGQMYRSLVLCRSAVVSASSASSSINLLLYRLMYFGTSWLILLYFRCAHGNPGSAVNDLVLVVFI